MNIVLSPDPVLRQVCEPCDPQDKGIKKLGKQMTKLMYKNNGCGLAAPQVGISKRCIVIDCTPEEEQNPTFLINPEIVELAGDPISEGEGCLSCPGISVVVERQPFARVRYSDLDGNECFIEGDGLLGRCLQHEIDHLDGKTLFEACDPIARIEVLQEYKAALAAGAKPGDTNSAAQVK